MKPPPDVPALPARAHDAHKGRLGRLLIVGGSPGLTGAVCLAAHGALRSGVGLVTCAVPVAVNAIIETKCTEPMSLPLPEDGSGTLGPESLPALRPLLERSQAVVIGPGLGRAARTGEFLMALLAELAVPHLIDADGLWHLAERAPAPRGRGTRVLTPHAGELARLLEARGAAGTGSHTGEDAGERDADDDPGAELAAEPGVVLVRKGPGTTVLEAGRRYRNQSGNPGLASGGTGDVLSGIIGAFLARGESGWDAAVRGVWLHGRAADLAAGVVGQESLIASDVIEHLPGAIRELEGTRR